VVCVCCATPANIYASVSTLLSNIKSILSFIYFLSLYNVASVRLVIF
jgi:hypothetical protein